MIQTVINQFLSPITTNEDVDAALRQHKFPLVTEDGVVFAFRGNADAVALRQWIYGLPSSVPMHRLGQTNLWYCVMQFPEGSRVEYKFEVRRNGNFELVHDPLNPNIAFDPFGGNSVIHCHGYEIPEWADRRDEVPRGQIEHIPIKSAAFGDERIVRVYLPPNYRDYRRYRLLICHDGDDYVLYSSLRAVLDNLIYRLEIPPLVVALTNPKDRLREYAADPRHAQHIAEELIPALEGKYSLINQASGRCLMGASFGGVASLSTAWRYPEHFGSLLLQSGSFAFTDIGDHSRSPAFDPVVKFMNEFRRNPGLPAASVFVSCGVYESLIYENRSLVPFLQDQGIDVKYVEARDGHNWENWRDRLRDGFTWLFPGPLWVTYM
jgi:enterochelin esterase-like enzyme